MERPTERDDFVERLAIAWWMLLASLKVGLSFLLLLSPGLTFSIGREKNRIPSLIQPKSSLRVTDQTILESDLKTVMGGRIEEAFRAAKERGEAAFVTFVTAGYPAAKGTEKSVAVVACDELLLLSSYPCCV